MEDLYPSRKREEVQITRRKDPVIHGTEEYDCPLTKDQLLAYEKNGYLYLENFFSESETAKMQQEALSLRNDESVSTRPEVVREPHNEEIRSIFAVHDHPFFGKVAAHERLTAIVSRLLGSEVYINQSRINYKPGFTGKEFYWHSDFETWHVEDGMPRMRAVSVSIALTDNHVFNGPLMLIPGSHQYFISCIGETPENHYKKSLQKQEFGVPDRNTMTWLTNELGIDVPTGPAGSVLLFECNTMHGSNGNITPYGRNNLFMVYNSVENRLVAPFSGGEPRPEYIAARNPNVTLIGS
ncbi:MAG TPA: ectoine hydroxylase [Bacillales bacterium]|nr:ectoine hydroxylase [Bacillales bacterium]